MPRWEDTDHTEFVDGLMLLDDPSLLALASEPFPWPSGRVPTAAEERDLALLAKRLPMIEVEVLHWTVEGVSQTQIGARLGVCQETVCYRLAKAIERSRFLLLHRELLDLEPVEVHRRLLAHPEISQENALIAAVFWRVASQVQTGRLLKCSQGKVRHRLILTRGHLEQHPTSSTALIRRGLNALWTSPLVTTLPDATVPDDLVALLDVA